MIKTDQYYYLQIMRCYHCWFHLWFLGSLLLLLRRSFLETSKLMLLPGYWLPIGLTWLCLKLFEIVGLGLWCHRKCLCLMRILYRQVLLWLLRFRWRFGVHIMRFKDFQQQKVEKPTTSSNIPMVQFQWANVCQFNQ